MGYNLSGTTITQAMVDTWTRLGLTPDQIQASIDYNRQYNADQAFRQAEQERIAAEQAAQAERDAAIKAVIKEVKDVAAQGSQAMAGQVTPGATIQEIIDAAPIDYAKAAAAVLSLEPSLTAEQALANVKAVMWNQEPTITPSTVQAAAAQEAAAKTVTPPPAPAAPVTAAAPTSLLATVAAALIGQGLPDYSDPAHAAAAAANDARLASDPAFVASEIERTLGVIAAREAAGLDTAAQETYLSRLYQAQQGTPWQVTGPGQQGAPAPATAGAGMFGSVQGWQIWAAVALAIILALFYGR